MFVDIKREFFSDCITKRETIDECINEFLQLKERYGDFLTQEVYCDLKGISRTTLKAGIARKRTEVNSR